VPRRPADYLRRATELTNDCGAAYSAMGAEATGLQLDYARGRRSGLAERAVRLLTATRYMPIVAADARLIAGGLALVRGDRQEAIGYVNAPGLRTPADGCAPQIIAATARVRGSGSARATSPPRTPTCSSASVGSARRAAGSGAVTW